jgi:hypothetical protein
MGKASRGTRMAIRITGQGRHYDLKLGDEIIYKKRNRQFSPFYKDAGTWVDKKGYEQDGLKIVRGLLASLRRCDYKFTVTIE